MMPRLVLLLLVVAVACQTKPRVVHYRWRQSTTLMLGDTLQLTAAVCRRTWCTGDTTLTIASSDTMVASVSADGTVRARALGRATVTLEAAGARPDTIAVRVVPRVVRIVLAPSQATVARGDSAVFEVRAFDARGNEVRDPPVAFEYEVPRSRRRMLAPRVTLLGTRAGTYVLIATVGDVADTSTFVVLGRRAPRAGR
jgi:hypothetical protein